MSISLNKVIPRYHGYIENGDSSKSVVRTIYSLFNRYPNQTSEVKKFLNDSNSKTKMLIIGTSQGQEPLTHIQSALEIAQSKHKNIEDVLDMSLIEAAEQMPIFDKADKYASKAAVNFLENLYKDSSKSYFSTPFETVVEKMKKQNSKKDVILFNNVIQHINYGKNQENEEAVLKSIDDLIDLTNDDGLFCFTCEPIVLKDYEHIRNCYNKVLNMLQNKGFVRISNGIYKKINPNTITQSQRAQALVNTITSQS